MVPGFFAAQFLDREVGRSGEWAGSLCHLLLVHGAQIERDELQRISGMCFKASTVTVDNRDVLFPYAHGTLVDLIILLGWKEAPNTF